MTDSVAQDQIKSFVRRVESLEDEIKVLNEDKSEVYKEAKSTGFDVKVLRRVIADRRKDSAERDEFDAVYDLYWSAIHGVVNARVEPIEQFDADGVEIEPQSAPQAARDEADDAVLKADPSSQSIQPETASEAAHAWDRLSATDAGGAQASPAPTVLTSKPRRPNCLHPEKCAGQGPKHCWSCEKAMGGDAA